MSNSRLIPGVIAALAVAGCANEAQQLDQRQPEAVEMALARGRFEFSCPASTGSVLSREMVAPAINGPMMVGGTYRAEYTIGVSGCGSKATYVVICPMNGTGCFAGDGRR